MDLNNFKEAQPGKEGELRGKNGGLGATFGYG